MSDPAHASASDLEKIREIWGALNSETFDYEAQMPEIERLCAVYPTLSALAYLVCIANRNRCFWMNYNAEHDNCKALVLKDIRNPNLGLDQVLGWDSYLPLHCDFSALECKEILESLVRICKTNKILPDPVNAKVSDFPSDIMTVGYFGSTFFHNAISHLVMNIPEYHDKEKISVNCYNAGTGDDDETLSPYDIVVRKSMRKSCNKFRLLNSKDSFQKQATSIKKDKCNILVDLDALMVGGKFAVFEHRPAPIVLSMVGYPGTSASKQVQYVLADERIVPLTNIDWMTEKVVYMPQSAHVGCHKRMYPNVKFAVRMNGAQGASISISSNRAIPLITTSPHAFQEYEKMILMKTQSCIINGHKVLNGIFEQTSMLNINNNPNQLVITSRKTYGLPEGPLVFASFNSAFKHHPALFHSWERILLAVPNSILWICCYNETDYNTRILDAASADLRARIYFSPSCSKEEYIRRGLLVDLFLDTWLCNGRVTTLDGLWSGTPVLTLEGNAFHRRIGSSFLYVLQLPVLVTHSKQEYIDRAVWLGQNPKTLNILRELIDSRKLVSSLYDVPQYVSWLENNYRKIWDRFVSGHLPDVILPESGHESWMKLLPSVDLNILAVMAGIFVLSPVTSYTDEAMGSISPHSDNIAFEPASPLSRCSDLATPFQAKGQGRKASGLIRSGMNKTPSPTDEHADASMSRKKMRPLQLFTHLQGVANVVDTPSPSQEAITPVGALSKDFSRAFASLRAIQPVGTEMYLTHHGSFLRHPIHFKAPDNINLINCGLQNTFYIGQKAVNLLVFETGVRDVLKSLMTPSNIDETCMGAIMGNQFMQLLEEYFDDGLPAMPYSLSICPDFFRSRSGLLFETSEQLAWINTFYDQLTGDTIEPEIGFRNIFDLERNEERTRTSVRCCFCPTTPPTVMKADVFVGEHFVQYHSAQVGDKVACNKCGKDMTRLSVDARQIHLNKHKRKPICKEMYYGPCEVETVPKSEPFLVNLNESFQKAAERYVREGEKVGLNVRKFYKAQKMATYTTWLAPACRLVLAHLKANPGKISGTSWIGYQFKSLLQCHLRSRLPPIIPNITSMASEARVTYCRTYFKFHHRELMFMMQRAFVNPDQMDESTWTVNSNDPLSNLICKMCGVGRQASLNLLIEKMKKDHMIPDNLGQDDACPICGFLFNTVDNDDPIIAKHANEHVHLTNWNETITQLRLGHTTKIEQKIQLTLS